MKQCVFSSAMFLMLLFSASGLFGQNWYQMPGLARDIAVGGPTNKSQMVIYMIGKETIDNRYGGAIYRWNHDLQDWDRLGGLAESVTVTPAGVPWVVNTEGRIYEMVNARWVERPGSDYPAMQARDIGVGMNGKVHIIDRSGNGVYTWSGRRWSKKCSFGHDGQRIDVDLNNNPWVVGYGNSIHRYQPRTHEWIDMTAPEGMYAYDVGADLSGWMVWITRAESYPEGGRLYYTTADSDGHWMGSMLPPEEAFKAFRVDMQQDVHWAVTASGQIWRMELE